MPENPFAIDFYPPEIQEAIRRRHAQQAQVNQRLDNQLQNVAGRWYPGEMQAVPPGYYQVQPGQIPVHPEWVILPPLEAQPILETDETPEGESVEVS